MSGGASPGQQPGQQPAGSGFETYQPSSEQTLQAMQKGGMQAGAGMMLAGRYGMLQRPIAAVQAAKPEAPPSQTPIAWHNQPQQFQHQGQPQQLQTQNPMQTFDQYFGQQSGQGQQQFSQPKGFK